MSRAFHLSLLALALMLSPARATQLPDFARPMEVIGSSGNGVFVDRETGLVWQAADDGVMRSWRKAAEFCIGLTLDNINDWTLPTMEQLMTIIDNTNTPKSKRGLTLDSKQYWTISMSSHTGGGSTGGRNVTYVDFKTGKSGIISTSITVGMDQCRVVCVQGDDTKLKYIMQ